MSTLAEPSRLRVADIVRVGTVGLRTRRLRAALSIVGVAIGIASMVAVLGISSSSRADLLATLDRLGTNLLVVQPGQAIFGGAATLPGTAAEMTARIDGVEAVATVEDVKDATARRSPYIDREETNAIGVGATGPALAAAVGATVRDGAFLGPATLRFPAVVLGAVAAERLGIDRVGDGVQIWIADRWFTVVGILDPVTLAPELDSYALVSRGYAARKLGADGSPSLLYVRADPESVEPVHELLAATASPEHPEEVDVSRPSDAIEARAAAKTALTSLFLGLGAIALLVGGVGIANVMVIAVLERRSEIGLRRALGAARRHVGVQFLAESLLLGALGGLLGCAAGALATTGYAQSRGWPVTVPPSTVLGGLAAAIAVGALAGLYPALRAARLTPTEALRSA